MAPLPVKLAAQEHLLPGRDLLEKWDFAVAHAIDGIELAGKPDFLARLPELRAAARAGVVLPTVCVQATRFIGAFDPEARREAVRHLRDLLSGIAAVGGQGAITPAAWGMFSRRLPPFEPPRGPEEDRAVLLEALGELGEHARCEGVTVLIEPLNRYEDHMLNTLAQAAEICAVLGSPSVRVMADSYHMNIEEADPPASLRQTAPYLGHVHLSDSNRLEPGKGHVPFAALFAALSDAGYSGWGAIECRLSGDAAVVLPAAVAFLRSQYGGWGRHHVQHG